MKKKLYTYKVLCSFEMQFTFTEDEVVQDDGGNDGEMEPSDDALIALQEEISEELSQHWIVDKVDAYAEFDNLLGIMDCDE